MGNTTCSGFKNDQDKQERQKIVDQLKKKAKGYGVSQNTLDLLKPVFKDYVDFSLIPTPKQITKCYENSKNKKKKLNLISKNIQKNLKPLNKNNTSNRQGNNNKQGNNNQKQRNNNKVQRQENNNQGQRNNNKVRGQENNNQGQRNNNKVQEQENTNQEQENTNQEQENTNQEQENTNQEQENTNQEQENTNKNKTNKNNKKNQVNVQKNTNKNKTNKKTQVNVQKNTNKVKVQGKNSVEKTFETSYPELYNKLDPQLQGLIKNYNTTKSLPNKNQLNKALKNVGNDLTNNEKKDIRSYLNITGGRRIKVTIGRNGEKYYFKGGKRISNPKKIKKSKKR